ncbi:MAG: hypothetical protein EA412_06185 [Chitinophagaceae bacterium]|nr:MAG: hypothetical protein EA412_06185 [Chitinophagaceae bacterium]
MVQFSHFNKQLKDLIMNLFKIGVLTILTASITLLGYARPPEGMPPVEESINFRKLASNCAPASSQIDLDVNNVRTTLLNGGDKWWNLNDARYEIPKIDPPGSAPSVHSYFAGSIWVGGFDAGGQLKIAAQTYRQSGDDFWPGPLDDNANVTPQVCQDYDRHWRVRAADIDQARAAAAAYLAELGDPDGEVNLAVSDIPQSLLDWPGVGNPYARGAQNVPLTIDNELAPFFDYDGDGIYDPTKGDFPVISTDCEDVYGDQMVFWVYNDKGNIHTATNGEAIGLQINATAFAFTTSDEINNMTFYRYTLINKASSPLFDVYMGNWADPDLGCFNTDYVGCDTTRNLGIIYNGTATDPDCATRGYGANPPISGITYFEGPKDTAGVEIGMSGFIYYNNDFNPVNGNPVTAIHHYNYLRGVWLDGSPITEGGDGTTGTVPTSYMFPGDPSDPTGWSECSENNNPSDRRFLQNSGPFVLQPGAVNNIITGVVWVQIPGVYPCPSFENTIGPASDKAQALFDNCFRLISGPDAPDLKIRELDREIIISLENSLTSNNVNEAYEEVDPILSAIGAEDSTYRFQGYKLYQVRNPQIDAGDLFDITRARLIAQVDVEDGVERLINWEFNPSINGFEPQVMVEGSDEGIRRTFRVTNDQFATGNTRLVNHKRYYFAVVAYAYNNYEQFDPLNPGDGGQNLPYLQGRRNFRIYSAIPHQTEPHFGTQLNAVYGQGMQVERIEGTGNGGNFLNITRQMVDDILASEDHKVGRLTYEPNQGPIDVKVYDPFLVRAADFTLRMIDTVGVSDTLRLRGQIGVTLDTIIINRDLSPTAYWELEIVDSDGQTTIVADNNLSRLNEQTLSEYGISLTIVQRSRPWFNRETGNGVIGASLTFDNPNIPWLRGVESSGTFSATNWIRSGINRAGAGSDFADFEAVYNSHYDSIIGVGDIIFRDPNDEFEDLINGTWAPYALAANRFFVGANDQPSAYSHGPAFPWRWRGINAYADQEFPTNNMHRLPSIDVVFTADKSKWTKAVVLETGEYRDLNANKALKGEIRLAPSRDVNGNVIPADTGRSYFPGYAINVETGERLNIMFGENSYLKNKRNDGSEMLWKPTRVSLPPLYPAEAPEFGGGHYIYVMETPYDEGEAAQRFLLDNYKVQTAPSANPNAIQTRPHNQLYKQIMWTSMPVLNPNFSFRPLREGLIPTDATVRLRVGRPYAEYVVDSTYNGMPTYFFSTNGLERDFNVEEVSKNALDEIRVVPNPYYAYSAYETSQLDNRVKITNLPSNATVSIYSIDGKLIRRFQRAIAENVSDGTPVEVVNLDNSLDWDLRNHQNIQISSGVYIIHINAPGIGERSIRWFGVLRPIDLDTF